MTDSIPHDGDTADPPKPQMMRLNPSKVPAQLKAVSQWVTWKLEHVGERWTKIPYCPQTGRKASSTDPETWSNFDAAIRAYERGGYSGVGFVVTREDPFSGIDIDGCVQDGKIAPQAMQWVQRFDSYAEISPSGQGIRIWVQADLPRGPKGSAAARRRAGKFEMYDAERFLTVTGTAIDGTTVIREGQEAVDDFHRTIFKKNYEQEQAQPEPRQSAPVTADLERVLQKARGCRTGRQFAALFDEGRWQGQYDSPSEADQALCNRLAFWCGGDPGLVDQLFRSSALMRDKWKRQDYRNATIQNAISSCNGKFYDWSKPSRNGSKSGGAVYETSPNQARKPGFGSVDSVWIPFPTGALPHPIAEFVEAAAKSLKVDETFFALPMLPCLAGAVGNAARIELHPDWHEPCVLWTAIVAESGTLKSPSLEIVSKPIRRKQARAIEAHEDAMILYQAAEMAYKEDYADWRKSGRKKGEPQPEPPTKPVCKRYYVGDTTVEALGLLLKENPKGLLVIKDELSGLFRGFNQYKAGKGSDASHYLSFYGARDLMIDRRTGDKTTIFVPRAAVSITGGIQPQILRDVLGTEHFADGLAARFLVGMPPRKAKEWSEEQISDRVREETDTVFERLTRLAQRANEHGDTELVNYPLTEDGKETWVAFFQEHAKEQVEMSGDLAAAWSKIEGATARIALVIHLVRAVAQDNTLLDPSKVDGSSVWSAVLIARWFKNEVRRVYGTLAETEQEREFREVIELLRRRGGRISARELCQSSRRFRGNTEAAEAFLMELHRKKVGRWVSIPAGPSGGRPTREFELLELSTEPEPQEHAGNGQVS